MIEIIEKLFSSDTFIPHGHCYLWQPELLWLHILSDSLIALSYYSIPLTLIYFVQKRKDLPFDWIFLLFSAFIVSCGTTHLMEIWTLWHPIYWLSGVLKAITAFISIYTAITLVELMPLALSLPSPAQVNLINQNLEQQIRDRKQIEESLRQREEQLRLTLDVTHIGFWDLDLLTKQMIWNDNNFTLLGIEQNTIEPSIEDWEARIHPEDREWVGQCFAHSLETNSDYEAEYRVIHPNGSIYWLLSKGKAVYDQAGNPIRSIGVALDINDRKLAEEKMQTINQQLESSVGELRQKNQEMQLVGEISDFLQSCSTVEEACATISTLAKPLFPNCTVGIFMIANSRNRLELINSWGNTDSLDSVFLPNDCWALRRGRSHWIGQDQHELLCKHTDHHHPPIESLCIPMIAQGETLGLLHLSSLTPDNLTESRRQLARTISEQLSLAIANLTLRATLQAQSIRDPLTGLFNRRHLEEFFQQEIHRAQRNQYSIGVIMIDIDHFKRFNDTFGHDAGDFILKEISQLLKDEVRVSDIACRFGGEEMILVLPNAPIEITLQRAEGIRSAIAQLRLVYNGSAIGNITASFGVACFPDHGATVNAVIQTADHALYRAKDGGRNQVIWGITSTMLETREEIHQPTEVFRPNPPV